MVQKTDRAAVTTTIPAERKRTCDDEQSSLHVGKRRKHSRTPSSSLHVTQSHSHATSNTSSVVVLEEQTKETKSDNQRSTVKPNDINITSSLVSTWTACGKLALNINSNYTIAIKCFESAIKHAPADVEVMNLLVDTMVKNDIKKNNFQGIGTTIDFINTAMHYSSEIRNDVALWTKLAEYYIMINDLEKAHSVIRSGLEFANSEPRLWLKLGKCLNKMNSHREAIEALTSALYLLPKSFTDTMHVDTARDVHLELVQLAIDGGDLESARNELASALSLPAATDFITVALCISLTRHLALCFERIKNFDNAIWICELAEAVFPECAEILLLHSYFMLLSSESFFDPVKARQLLHIAVKKDKVCIEASSVADFVNSTKGDFLVWLLLAESYCHSAQYAFSLDCLEIAARKVVAESLPTRFREIADTIMKHADNELVRNDAASFLAALNERYHSQIEIPLLDLVIMPYEERVYRYNALMREVNNVSGTEQTLADKKPVKDIKIGSEASVTTVNGIIHEDRTKVTTNKPKKRGRKPKSKEKEKQKEMEKGKGKGKETETEIEKQNVKEKGGTSDEKRFNTSRSSLMNSYDDKHERNNSVMSVSNGDTINRSMQGNRNSISDGRMTNVATPLTNVADSRRVSVLRSNQSIIQEQQQQQQHHHQQQQQQYGRIEMHPAGPGAGPGVAHLQQAPMPMQVAGPMQVEQIMPTQAPMQMPMQMQQFPQQYQEQQRHESHPPLVHSSAGYFVPQPQQQQQQQQQQMYQMAPPLDPRLYPDIQQQPLQNQLQQQSQAPQYQHMQHPSPTREISLPSMPAVVQNMPSNGSVSTVQTPNMGHASSFQHVSRQSQTPLQAYSGNSVPQLVQPMHQAGHNGQHEIRRVPLPLHMHMTGTPSQQMPLQDGVGNGQQMLPMMHAPPPPLQHPLHPQQQQLAPQMQGQMPMQMAPTNDARNAALYADEDDTSTATRWPVWVLMS